MPVSDSWLLAFTRWATAHIICLPLKWGLTSRDGYRNPFFSHVGSKYQKLSNIPGFVICLFLYIFDYTKKNIFFQVLLIEEITVFSIYIFNILSFCAVTYSIHLLFKCVFTFIFVQSLQSHSLAGKNSLPDKSLEL